MFSEKLANAGVTSVIETNVVCYGAKKKSSATDRTEWLPREYTLTGACSIKPAACLEFISASIFKKKSRGDN
jgi:hypothetical protein